MSKPYFPLFIDISQKKIVVAGGGKIAERRIETLLKFTEQIQVVSPDLSGNLYRLSQEGKIMWKKGAYTSEVLTDAYLVLAATDDESCNEQIAADCKERGILVNTAHKKELCDFYFPAAAVRGNMVAGITASGIDHAKAGEVRAQVQRLLENQ